MTPFTQDELADLENIAYKETLKALKEAKPMQLYEGRRWYQQAHQRAQALHDDIHVAAQIVAVLSPRQRWNTNLRDAEKFILGHEIEMTALKANIVKAWQILEGEELPDITVAGKKTLRFAHNIEMPDGCSHVRSCVTLDSWMMRTFELNYRWIERVGVYEALEEGVRRAADNQGIMPHQAQAITWLVQKEREPWNA